MKPCRRTAAVLCLAMAGTLASLPANAQTFYQWVDDKGVTHFTQTPPPGHPDSTEIQVQLKASSDQEDELRARAARQQAEQEARRKAAEDAERAARNQPPKPPGPSEAQCAQLRANLEVLRRDSMVRSRDPDTGEEKMLHDDERREMIQQAEERLKEC